jgi:hypothetical protein
MATGAPQAGWRVGSSSPSVKVALGKFPGEILELPLEKAQPLRRYPSQATPRWTAAHICRTSR